MRRATSAASRPPASAALWWGDCSGRALRRCGSPTLPSVYGAMSPLERVRQHRRIVELITTAGGDELDELATHLRACPPAGSVATVEWLRRSAARALALGAPKTAVSDLRRALAEPPSETLKAQVLYEAGFAEWRAGSAVGGDLRAAAARLADHVVAAAENDGLDEPRG